jgi:hypothetical protein
MKKVTDVTACVIDFGTFLSVAEILAETMTTVYYHTPIDMEFLDVRESIKGSGLKQVKRLDDIFDPDVLENIDLFVFPDIGFAGLQRYFRKLGKAVWGHLGATELELYRTKFLDMLEDTGLPMVHNERIVGLTALGKYLKGNEDVWVKIDRFRYNMETWQNRTWEQSQRTLESLAVILGGMKEEVTFIVQDNIESDIEVGYDGWCIDGKYPEASFQGYEKKNQSYLGSVIAWDDLPDEIRVVNEALAPVLADYGYRCWLSTEIRIVDGVPYFIDITPRMAGQTCEHQLETISNLADVIWQGANGVVVQPRFLWNFAAEATLHYDSDTKSYRDQTVLDEWKSLNPPEDIMSWVKFYHYCQINGEYQFPQRHTDEVGVVLGVGDDIEDAIENLKANFDKLKYLPLHIDTASFAELLKCIKIAEHEGIQFGGRVPDAKIALSN